MSDIPFATPNDLNVVVHQNLDTGEWSIKFPGMAYKGFGLERKAFLTALIFPADVESKALFSKDEIAPVDRSAIQLASGEPVMDDHRDIDPVTGQQKAYVMLTPDERAKGFVRPYRDAYRHLTCGTITTMGRAIAETYARDPFFYSATFCCACKAHFPIGEDGEFTWYEMDYREGLKVGT